MNNTPYFIKRFFQPISLLFVVNLLLALLMACGGDGEEPPPLVVPTLAATAVAPTDIPTAMPTPTEAPPLPTATLPPAPTVAPPVPTPVNEPPTATATTISQATTAPEATPVVGLVSYQVAFVAANDMLNIRRQPNFNAPVVGRLAPNAGGIQITDGGESLQSNYPWALVETSEGEGWVNSHFLTESVSREAFCGDPEVTALLERFRQAVTAEDGKALLDIVHLERGLRVRLNWWNEEVKFDGPDLQTLFNAQRQYDWGMNEGSGEEIRGSFSEIVMPFLERDLLPASEQRCDEGLFGPTAGMTILPEGYEQVRFYSLHRPAPAEQELDWGTWIIGVERWEGRYYISYLVHYRWEI
jgi:hypothetical protein